MSETMFWEGNENRLSDRLSCDESKSFPVSVIMQKTVSDNIWIDEIWDAVGVTVGELNHSDTIASTTTHTEKNSRLIFKQEAICQYLISGFNLELFVDECESYYYNLISSSPRCFIVADKNEDDVPVPFLVSLSFDVAHSYLEGDETVYAVDLPPELYRWSEAFILNHYAPEKKIKRKRTNWKQAVCSKKGSRKLLHEQIIMNKKT